jgi:23S rRNA (uracil1939-C5)-methyltransferase
VSESFELRIDSIAAGGDGVGRHDGMVVFVPRTAPGDLARVSARKEGRLMRGRLDALLEASPSRVEPPCAHYVGDRCGGCQIQHLLYEAQLDAKAGIIRDALQRIGRVAVEKPRVHRQNEWRYRVKLTLALRKQNGGWIAGLRRYDAPDEVFELRDCPITTEIVLACWASIMRQQIRLPLADELRGAVRLTEDGFAFTLQGGHHWPHHRAFFEALPELTELWWEPAGKPRRLVESRASNREAGAAFVQVNPMVANAVQSWMLGAVSAYHPKTVVDAYAGSGEVAEKLARQGARVTAIEVDRDAVRVAAARLPQGSRAIAGRVEDVIESSLPADVVIVNPPRTGLDERVTRVLETQLPKPKALIYVSCNPATLARDLSRLGSYRLKSLVGFDMFPQTAHVETACELVPAA